MNNYCMNSRSQGMRKTSPEKYKANMPMFPEENSASTSCHTHIHWGDTPIAMAYVPKQKYGTIFDLCKALEVGTIFPELYKPFCGKGGGC